MTSFAGGSMMGHLVLCLSRERLSAFGIGSALLSEYIRESKNKSKNKIAKMFAKTILTLGDRLRWLSLNKTVKVDGTSYAFEESGEGQSKTYHCLRAVNSMG